MCAIARLCWLFLLRFRSFMSQHTTIQQIFMATEQSDPVVVLHAVGDVRGSQFEMLLQKSGLDADKVLEIVHEGLSGGDLLYFTTEDFELFGIDAACGENILENLRATLLERGVTADEETTLAQTLTAPSARRVLKIPANTTNENSCAVYYGLSARHVGASDHNNEGFVLSCHPIAPCSFVFGHDASLFQPADQWVEDAPSLHRDIATQLFPSSLEQRANDILDRVQIQVLPTGEPRTALTILGGALADDNIHEDMPSDVPSEKFLSLSLRSASELATPLADRLFRQESNRVLFSPQKPDTHLADDLSDSAESVEDLRVVAALARRAGRQQRAAFAAWCGQVQQTKQKRRHHAANCIQARATLSLRRMRRHYLLPEEAARVRVKSRELLQALAQVHRLPAMHVPSDGRVSKSELATLLRTGALVVDGHPFSAADAMEIAKLLRHNASLTDLQFYNTNFGHKGALAIIDTLDGNSSSHVRTLALGACHLGHSVAELLVSKLQHNYAAHAKTSTSMDSTSSSSTPGYLLLHKLRLEHNPRVGTRGASALATLVAKPDCLLRELYLDYCGVGDEGVLAIADALRASSNLRTLSLGGNNIGSTGAAALGSALGVRDSASYKRGAKAKRWSKLSVLRLGNNKIGETGAVALCRGLQGLAPDPLLVEALADSLPVSSENAFGQASSTVTEIDLSGNMLSDSSATAIATCLQAVQCRALANVRLERNLIGARGMAALANAVRSRHDVPNLTETFATSPRSSGADGGGGWLRQQQWEWVSGIDQIPLWGNVASDEAVQAALRDARAAKQFPANFLKSKNRMLPSSKWLEGLPRSVVRKVNALALERKWLGNQSISNSS